MEHEMQLVLVRRVGLLLGSKSGEEGDQVDERLEVGEEKVAQKKSPMG